MIVPGSKALDTGKVDIAKLEELYLLYEGATKDFSVKCHDKCPTCCTSNVVVTSYEIAFIVKTLSPGEIKAVKNCLASNFPEHRYAPGMTTNGFARNCLEHEAQAPEEENSPGGRCPLLSGGQCTIYRARPFGCRNMMSEIDCKDSGYARIPPLALTINTIFLQYIEHLDCNGVTGNFADMLWHFLGMPEKQGGRGSRLINNHRIPVLMVPPEHRSQVSELVGNLSFI